MQTSLEYEHMKIKPGMPVEVIGVSDGKQYGTAVSGELVDWVGCVYYRVKIGKNIYDCDKWQVFQYSLKNNRERLNKFQLINGGIK